MSSDGGSATAAEELAAPLVSRHRSESISDDYNIHATNEDATECKRSAVHLGYWKDSFVEVFFGQRPVARKDPEINLGYWARVAAVRQVVDRFIAAAGPSAQIVNLGAGFDTLYWQLSDVGAQLSAFVDVDFSSVTAKKIHHILKPGSPLLAAVAGSHERLREKSSHADVHGERYHLIGADLRQIDELDAKLRAVGLRADAPTLLLAECVLVYMACEQTDALLAYLAKSFPHCAFVNYEQVNVGDRFGMIMQENLHSRGISLAGVKDCESLDTQCDRFQRNGFAFKKAWLMNQVYRDFLPSDEKKRVELLERLDEKGLLQQLHDHYCFVIASTDEHLLQSLSF